VSREVLKCYFAELQLHRAAVWEFADQEVSNTVIAILELSYGRPKRTNQLINLFLFFLIFIVA